MGFDQAFTFAAVSDDPTGANLQAAFEVRWPAYANWYLSGADNRERPSAEECRAQLQLHMPELLPCYDHLLHRLAPPSHPELLPQLLSLYNAPAFIAGCSQAVWRRPGEAALIRNYDFPHRLWDAMLLHSNWNGTRVMAMTDCLWGVLDGINEHGLAVSLSFGGRMQVGDGFSVTLILRYILEFCHTVEQACAVLQRVPVSMTYNVVVMDCHGNSRTVFIGPGQAAEVTERLSTTNHQPLSAAANRLNTDEDVLPDSRVRDRFLQSRLTDPQQSLPHLQQLFLSEPLYRSNKDARGWGTIYTSMYQPQLGTVSVMWPNQQLVQSFGHFQDTRLQVHPARQPLDAGDHVS